MIDLSSLPTCVLDNGLIHIEAFTTAGPRITHLSAFGGPNLLAVLSNTAKETTSYGDYHFMGGHRLWHSPEALPRTYLPDNDGVTTETLPGGIRLIGPTEPGSGIAKTIEVQLVDGRAAVTMIHTLRNDGLWPVEFAPWTVSMFRLGGTAIFPQPVGAVNNLLPNRNLSIWPYSHIDDPRLTLRDDYILINAVESSLPALKIGYSNPHGWVGYWVNGILFRKSFDIDINAAYPDRGCNTECYASSLLIELEALGPLKTVAPGESVTLTETWEVFQSLDQPFLSAEIQAFLTK